MAMKNCKQIIIIIVLFLIIGGIILCLIKWKNIDEVRDYPQIETEGTLRIVTDYNAVGYYVSGDTIAGFNSELVKLLQKYTPIHIELVVGSQLSEMLDGLRQGKYDIVATNIPVTTQLRDSFHFSLPVALDKLVLVQRKKEYNYDREPIRSHLYLAKKKLYVSHNSPAILRIRNLSHEIGDTIYYVEDPLYGPEQLAMKVASREIDYAVCDEQSIREIAPSLPEIDYGTYIGFTHIEAWAVRLDSPILLDSLNIWLQKVKATDEYKKLINQHDR